MLSVKNFPVKMMTFRGELSTLTGFRPSVRPTSYPTCSSKSKLYLSVSFLVYPIGKKRNLIRTWSLSSKKKPTVLNNNVYDDSKLTESEIRDEGDCNKWVDVIGIGSRKDAILDFCLDSPFNSSSLRFWDTLKNDSSQVVELQQWLPSKGAGRGKKESFPSIHSCAKAIILVATAGYGLDQTAAIDIIGKTRSANGFGIAVIIRPFSFEGKRRQTEVENLIENLQKHTNMCLVIDPDTLLKKDLVTLDEALKTANNAVLLAINSISVLITETQKRLLDVPNSSMKELGVSELMTIVESYKDARIGFGTGYNIKASISQAMYDCPFLNVDLKDLNGMVICVLASSEYTKEDEVSDFLHIFRQSTGYMKEIIISSICEPNLEPNLLVTTVIVLGICTGGLASRECSILSRLAQKFPFVLNLLWRDNQQSDGSIENSAESSSLLEVAEGSQSGAQNGVCVDDTSKGLELPTKELEPVLGNIGDEVHDFGRSFDDGNEQSEYDMLRAGTDSSYFDNHNGRGVLSRTLGPGYQIAQEWAKERAADYGPAPIPNNLSIFLIPVGVRRAEDLKGQSSTTNMTLRLEPRLKDDTNEQTVGTNLPSWDLLTDAGFEAVKNIYNSASTVFKGKPVNTPKKQGELSARAASMLEAERDVPKKWNPTVEMQYRGGIYRGRCEGGLPEGKGRLTLQDGSIYDGMWHYGKRSGTGTIYFRNGDVFQGSWRDDLMHGKGWFYFHTGDRWFANFWKGKANGEGRFYSKLGNIFFGQFQDGLRQGPFICIDVDGARWREVWDEGVLVSCEPLDSDVDDH